MNLDVRVGLCATLRCSASVTASLSGDDMLSQREVPADRKWLRRLSTLFSSNTDSLRDSILLAAIGATDASDRASAPKRLAAVREDVAAL